VLEDEKIRRLFACHPEEPLVVVLHRALHQIVIRQLDADRNLLFDQMTQVSRLFECLLRGASGITFCSRLSIEKLSDPFPTLFLSSLSSTSSISPAALEASPSHRVARHSHP